MGNICYKWNKIDLVNLSQLNSMEKEELLKLIITDLKGKVNNEINEYSISDSSNLDTFFVNGILSKIIKPDTYWELEGWYLTIEDFKKLNLNFSEEEINEMINNFINWKNTNKLKRTNIYLTLSKWLKDNKKFIITEEQKNFIENSYKAYNNSVQCEFQENDILKYTELLYSFFKKGFTVEELREYWKKVIIVETKRGDDKKYKRKALTVMKEFEVYKTRN